jgi:hypothetical protein
MAKIICKYCGKEEDIDHWVPETKAALENEGCCFSCHHWKTQYELDKTERGEHGYAIINGTHYVLLPHTDVELFKGYGGRKFMFKFNDGYEIMCDNVWCQGDIPDGRWRDLMPDNASWVVC